MRQQQRKNPQRMIEDNNNELAQLAEKKNEMLLMFESEQIMDYIGKIKKEILQFLNFNELTPEFCIASSTRSM